MFSILSRRCPLLATSLSVLFCLLSMLISDSRFDLVWFRLSCYHGWIRSASVNVRKQQQQQQQLLCTAFSSTPLIFYRKLYYVHSDSIFVFKLACRACYRSECCSFVEDCPLGLAQQLIVTGVWIGKDSIAYDRSTA